MHSSLKATEILLACAKDARVWLFDAAAPLWCDTGLLSDGLFAEQLDLAGKPVQMKRRVRVQARQVFAACQLGKLGWHGPWCDAAERAITHLVRVGKRPDGFFVHSFDEVGAPFDKRADLYDSAFLLFALAHAGSMLAMPALFDEARALMNRITDHWAHPHGGYREGEIEAPPRRQNPHMHLLEAAITLHAATGDVYWAGHVETLAELGCRRLIDQASGAVTEYFADDWSRDPVAGDLVEPGHCLEWAWLLDSIGRIEPADRLVAFARRHGLAPGSLYAVNAVRLDGIVLDRNARLWPQTERLKAALARVRRFDDMEAEAAEAVAAWRGLQHHLSTPLRGLWHDRLYSDGTPVPGYSPASSFYHVVLALSELIKTAAFVQEHRAGLLTN